MKNHLGGYEMDGYRPERSPLNLSDFVGFMEWLKTNSEKYKNKGKHSKKDFERLVKECGDEAQEWYTIGCFSKIEVGSRYDGDILLMRFEVGLWEQEGGIGFYYVPVTQKMFDEYLAESGKK
jgi:hypothetical protein